MPFFDRRCGSCGTVTLDSFEPSDAPTILCAECGEPTDRVWLSKASNVIGDECDFVRMNGTREPFRVTSKIEDRRWLKERGYRIKDEHIGQEGSDKSTLSQRCGGMDPQTLANATALVSRDNSAGWRDPEKAPIGISSDEGLIRYLGDRRRVEQRGEFGFSDR